MTCIVGLVHGQDVYLGSDSQCSWGWQKQDIGSKVLEIGCVAIAHTGKAAIAAQLAHRLTIPPVHEAGEEKFLHVHLPDAIRETLNKSKLIDDKGEVRGGGCMIIGWRGRLVQLDAHLAVYPANAGLAAWGSGGEHAIGALAATKTLKPRDRIRRAIGIAAQWAPGVGGDIHIVKVKRA